MAGVGYVGLSGHVTHNACARDAWACACARRPIMALKPYNPTPDGGHER